MPLRAQPPRDVAPLRIRRQPEQTQTRAARCWLAFVINPRIGALPRHSASFTLKSPRASCATRVCGDEAAALLAPIIGREERREAAWASEAGRVPNSDSATVGPAGPCLGPSRLPVLGRGTPPGAATVRFEARLHFLHVLFLGRDQCPTCQWGSVVTVARRAPSPGLAGHLVQGPAGPGPGPQNDAAAVQGACG